MQIRSKRCANCADRTFSVGPLPYVLLVFLSLLTIPIVAQSPTPLLRVEVIDVQGSVVPQANIVLLRGGSVLGRNTTSPDGTVKFQVEAGAYEISIQSDGFIPIDKPVQITSAAQQTLRFPLAIAATENVEVNAPKESALDSSASPGANLHAAEVAEIPMRPLTVTDALPLVPGVVRGPDGQVQIAGATEMHSALLVNSVDTSDPATGRFGLSVPIDVVDSLHVLTTPYLAQYGRFSAGVVDAETRPGGSKWKFDLNDPFPEFRIRSGHVRGLRSMSPRATVTGPLVKDRADLTQAVEVVVNKIPVRTLYFPNNEIKDTSINSFTQIDLTLTPQQTLTGTLHLAPQKTQFAGLSFFRPQEVTPNDTTAAYTGTLIHRLAVGAGLLQTTVAYSRQIAEVTPQGTQPMVVQPTGNTGNFFSSQTRNSHRFEWNEVWSAPIANFPNHTVQFGGSVASTGEEGQVQANTIFIRDNSGTTLRKIDFYGGSTFHHSDLQPAVFAQDHWKAAKDLAIDAGIRFEGQNVTSTTRVAPRLGFIWSPDSNRKTIIRGGFGAFYDSVPLQTYALSQYPEQVFTDYGIDGKPSISAHYQNVMGQSGPDSPWLIHRKVTAGNFAPYTFAGNAEIDHTFSPKLSVRARYMESQGSRLLTLTQDQVQHAFVLSDAGSSRYRQLELTANLKLQPSHSLYLSYVRSTSTGPLNSAEGYLSDIPSPFIRSARTGPQASDLPNRFLLWGSIGLPSKIVLYPMIETRSGFTWQSLDVYQQFLSSESAKAHRLPGYLSIDLRVSKDFRVNEKYSIRPSISVTNVTNHFNALDVHSNTADPQYGQAFGNYDRHIRFDLDVVF